MKNSSIRIANEKNFKSPNEKSDPLALAALRKNCDPP